jgi:hypothetical protein
MAQAQARDPDLEYLMRRGDLVAVCDFLQDKKSLEKDRLCSPEIDGEHPAEECLPGIVIDRNTLTEENRRLFYEAYRSPSGDEKECRDYGDSYECWKSRNPRTVYIRRADGVAKTDAWLERLLRSGDIAHINNRLGFGAASRLRKQLSEKGWMVGQVEQDDDTGGKIFDPAGGES